MNEPKPKRRRWYQFSLRTLMLFMAVVAVVCGLFLPRCFERIRRERLEREYWEAVVPLRDLGGRVRPSERPIGEQGKDAIECVSFTGMGPGIVGGRLTDEEFTRLREHLESLSSLRILELSRTRVTDAGLANVAGLTNLERLWLSGSFSGEGLEHLKGLPNLKTLWLSFTFSDAGLEHLQGMPNLVALNLGYSGVTDAGLEHLQGLTNLEELYLFRTQVTDSGLEHLKGLTSLKHLGLRDTQVTDEGVEKLQKALPECEITH